MELTEEDILGIVDAHGTVLGQVVRRLLDEVRGRQTRVTMDVYRELMGKATWEWDQELGMHMPKCSRFKYNVTQGTYRCGNPLADADLESGTCPHGPHLERHERSR